MRLKYETNASVVAGAMEYLHGHWSTLLGSTRISPPSCFSIIGPAETNRGKYVVSGTRDGKGFLDHLNWGSHIEVYKMYPEQVHWMHKLE